MSTLENEKSLSIFEISRMATINGPGIRTMVRSEERRVGKEC